MCRTRPKVYRSISTQVQMLSVYRQMNQRQWQEVEAIVRKEQTVALQHMNNKRYDELAEILDELYKLAHD